MLAKIYGETDKDLELKTLAKANKIFPNHYLIMYDLASLKLFKTGEKEEALELLFKCVEKLPQLPNNWAMLGTAYIMLREFEMAKTCFETALNLEPDHLNSVLGIGVYHFENANFVYTGLHAILAFFISLGVGFLELTTSLIILLISSSTFFKFLSSQQASRINKLPNSPALTSIYID